jgi:hypothetical protein
MPHEATPQKTMGKALPVALVFEAARRPLNEKTSVVGIHNCMQVSACTCSDEVLRIIHHPPFRSLIDLPMLGDDSGWHSMACYVMPCTFPPVPTDFGDRAVQGWTTEIGNCR